MQKTLKSIRPDKDVEVICNDRRNSYGVPKDVQKEDDTKYIILDMGSNEMDYIKSVLGDDTFVIDRHLIEEAHIRDKFTLSPNLIDPHSLHNGDDKDNARYCTTGIAYRIYQTCRDNIREFQFDEKQDNTAAITACIGTVGDAVNLMDMNSYNRAIVKDGMNRIDNATEDNLDYQVGYMLRKNGISDVNTNTTKLAFNIVSYINAASRMSDYMDRNGAQRSFNALTGDEREPDTYFEPDGFIEVNSEKKKLCSKLLHSLTGIMSGRIAEATDKAAIFFVTTIQRT